MGNVPVAGAVGAVIGGPVGAVIGVGLGAAADGEARRRNREAEQRAQQDHDRLMREKAERDRAFAAEQERIRKQNEELARQNAAKQAEENRQRAERDRLAAEQEKERRELAAAKAAAEQRRKEEEDAAKLRTSEESRFQNFLQAIQHTPKSRPVNGVVKIAVVGQVSTGKSTIINALMGNRVAKSGGGRTTLQASSYKKMSTLVKDITLELTDVPGNDADFDYTNMANIGLFATMHLFVIVYTDTISYTRRIAAIACALNKPVIFLRNKADNIGAGETAWPKALEADKQMIKRDFGVANPDVFCVSARNSLYAKEKASKVYEQFQWQSFDEFMQAKAASLCV